LTFLNRLAAILNVTSQGEESMSEDKTIRVRHEMTNDETGDLAAVMEIAGVHMGDEAGLNRAEPSAAIRNTNSAAQNMFLSLQFLA
jgi:hypothetical protein